MKVSKKLNKYVREKPLRISELKRIRRNFQDAELSKEEALDYIIDEINREKYDSTIKRIFEVSNLAFFVTGITTTAIAYAKTNNQNILVAGVGVSLLGAFYGLYTIQEGYNLFSKFRNNYYDDIKSELSKKQILEYGKRVEEKLEVLTE